MTDPNNRLDQIENELETKGRHVNPLDPDDVWFHVRAHDIQDLIAAVRAAQAFVAENFSRQYREDGDSFTRIASDKELRQALKPLGDAP